MEKESEQKIVSEVTLKRHPVTNFKNDEIGHLEELILDLKTGDIAFAVISFGGILGFGDRFFSVPWKAIHLDINKKAMKLNISKEKLDQLPYFYKDDWPDFTDTVYRETLNKVYSGVGNFTYFNV